LEDAPGFTWEMATDTVTIRVVIISLGTVLGMVVDLMEGSTAAEEVMAVIVNHFLISKLYENYTKIDTSVLSEKFVMKGCSPAF
jgi:cell shape-determining protein MreD